MRKIRKVRKMEATRNKPMDLCHMQGCMERRKSGRAFTDRAEASRILTEKVFIRPRVFNRRTTHSVLGRSERDVPRRGEGLARPVRINKLIVFCHI